MAPRPDPTHPVARGLHGVDLSGGASTIGRDGTVIGDAARLRALKGGFAENSGSSLLDAWRRWQEHQVVAGTSELQAIRKALDALERSDDRHRAREVEERALRKARKKMLRRLKDGHGASDARVRGYAHYLKHGGKLGPTAFSRKVVGG